MLYERSTLASIAHVLSQTIRRDYNLEFADGTFPPSQTYRAGERISIERMDALWRAAVDATNDLLIGVKVGRNIEPSHFYAFGHSWLASESLLGAIRRLCRYDKIIATNPAVIEVRQCNGDYQLIETYPDLTAVASKESLDFGVSAVLKLCEISAGRPIRPLRVELMCTDKSQMDEYRVAFDAPVQLCCPHTAIYFSREDLDEPLRGSIPEVAQATDRISEKYIETLDTSKVATKVKHLLISFLPSGDADQARVAHALHCSTSTLQRHLQSEGRNFRDILEETRRSLAEEYLRDGKNSLAQIAYLLGFGDQSNFSRAFKRWTGVTPSEFQASIESADDTL